MIRGLKLSAPQISHQWPMGDDLINSAHRIKPPKKIPKTQGLRSFQVGKHRGAGRVAHLEKAWKL